ncbi:hypothetical protein TRAPUB_11455, partial [Trametes pubescens]
MSSASGNPDISSPPSGICVCSKCRHRTWEDKHKVKHPGVPYSAKTINRHKLHDALLEKKAEIQRAVLGDAVFLATLGVPLAKDDVAGLSEPEDVDVDAEPLMDEQPKASDREDDAGVAPVNAVKTRRGILSSLQSGLAHRLPLIPSDARISFSHNPVSIDDPPAPIEPRTPHSRHFIEVYEWLKSSRRYLATLEDLQDRDVDAQLAALICKIDENTRRLEDLQRHWWAVMKVETGICGPDPVRQGGPMIFDTTRLYESRATLEPFVLAALIMTTILHAVHSVSRVDSNYILATLRVLLFGAFMFCNRGRGSQLTAAQRLMLQTIPKDVRSALKKLHINPEIIRYACCPRCFKTYPPDDSRPTDPYPHHCDFSETDKPVCGTPLVVRQKLAPLRKGEPRRVVYTAIKPYPYRSFASWLACLFSRPELERILVESWTSSAAPASSKWTDIFHSPEIRKFRGPDGQLFSVQPPGSTHLVFSLFVDWFNPYGNKQAGKSHSIGAIYLVCLNLPPHLRFRPENVYLAAVIPGPKEPSLHQLNHLLRPLVDELEIFWTRGLYLQRTALRFVGMLLRVAIIPLVCDLPALRKTAGFAGHSSKHFCSFCRLRKQHMSDLNRPWATRTAEEHRRKADEWRHAATEAERNAAFEEHGIRWSELLRLPYWNPLRFSVVDAMHCLFLGDLRHHCRDVWGIDVKDKTGSQKVAPHSPDEQRLWLDRVVAALTRKSRSALTGIRKGYLATVAQVNDIALEQKLTKKEYISALLGWVDANPVDKLVLPPVLGEDTTDFHLAEGPHDISKFRVLTQDVIDTIRADIENTILPSWLQRPPKNFGSAAHGKLKADQWRTVCTVSMTITLTRLWGITSATSKDRLLLDNFIHLVIAVDLATRRSMDKARALAFDHHMLQYLLGLREIFSHELVPNHHLSLHLVTCLLMFGPVHGWWAFPFERYNGLLQNLNTNNLPDDIPLTFMRGFYSGAELRWLMASTEWPADDTYAEMVSAYESAFQDAIRGTRVSDVLALNSESVDGGISYDVAKQVRLERELYETLLKYMPPSFASHYGDVEDARPRIAPYVQHIHSTQKGGLTFATRTHGRRDSYVLLATSNGQGQLRPGQISDILLHTRLENHKQIVSTFVIVDAFAELVDSDVTHDPFRAYPELETRLCYNRSDSQLFVPLDDIVSHFAALVYEPAEIGKECIVCRSLDRSTGTTARNRPPQITSQAIMEKIRAADLREPLRVSAALRSIVRKHLRLLLNISSWNDLPLRCPPLTDAETILYGTTASTVQCNIHHFRMDLEQSWTTFPLNREARDVFCLDLLEAITFGRYLTNFPSAFAVTYEE